MFSCYVFPTLNLFLLVTEVICQSSWTGTPIKGVSIDYNRQLSSTKASCEAILTGCSGGFSETSEYILWSSCCSRLV